MVVLALAASVLQVVSSDLAAVPDATYIPLFFTLGAHRNALVRWFGMACVVVAAMVAGLWAGFVQDKTGGLDPASYRGGALAAVTAVFTGGGWGAGYLRWQRRQAVQSRVDAELSAAEQRRISALFEQEHERGQIAADVRDLVAARPPAAGDPGHPDRGVAAGVTSAVEAPDDAANAVLDLYHSVNPTCRRSTRGTEACASDQRRCTERGSAGFARPVTGSGQLGA